MTLKWCGTEPEKMCIVLEGAKSSTAPEASLKFLFLVSLGQLDNVLGGPEVGYSPSNNLEAVL